MSGGTESVQGAPRPQGRADGRLSGLLGGGLWALGAKIVSQGAQLTAFVMAAHFLTPVEFGFFAFTSALAVLLVVLAEGGWAEYIMKSEEDADRMAQVAGVSLASGIAFSLLGLAVAGILYRFYDLRWEAWLLGLFCLWVLPSAMTTVYDGALVHRGQLDRQAAIRIAAETGGLALIVFGLYAGWNIFALVAGRLLMQLIVLCGSVGAVGWVRPAAPTRPVLGEILHFSRHILFNRLIVFLRSYSGTLVVGGFLGLTEAGYYRAAERIVAAFSELVGEPARMLAWIVFRRARDGSGPARPGGDAVTRAGNVFFPVLFAVAAPTYFGLALVADNLVAIALGDAWAPAALLVSVLAAKQLLLIPGYVSEPLLSIRGAVRRLPPVSLFNALVALALIVALAPFGVFMVALGQCLAAVVAFATSVWVQARYGGLDWRRIARNSAVVMVAIGAMLAGVHALGAVAGGAQLGPLVTFLLQVATGAAIYSAVLFLAWKLVGVSRQAFAPGEG